MYEVTINKSLKLDPKLPMRARRTHMLFISQICRSIELNFQNTNIIRIRYNTTITTHKAKRRMYTIPLTIPYVFEERQKIFYITPFGIVRCSTFTALGILSRLHGHESYGKCTHPIHHSYYIIQYLYILDKLNDFLKSCLQFV